MTVVGSTCVTVQISLLSPHAHRSVITNTTRMHKTLTFFILQPFFANYRNCFLKLRGPYNIIIALIRLFFNFTYSLGQKWKKDVAKFFATPFLLYLFNSFTSSSTSIPCTLQASSNVSA